MILSFETKHFDKGNKEKDSTASLLAFIPAGTQAERAEMEGYTAAMPSERPTFSEKRADHPYLWFLDNAISSGCTKGKGCPPCGRSSRRKSHIFNISAVVLLLLLACYLPTTEAISDSTNHFLKAPATRTLPRTISEDDSPPAAFTGSVAASGDASSSSSSAMFGPNGLLVGGEDQHQHLDAEFQSPLVIQADSTKIVQGIDDVSINDKVRTTTTMNKLKVLSDSFFFVMSYFPCFISTTTL